MGNKICRTCNETKKITEFHNYNGIYRLDCKICFRAIERDKRLSRIIKVDLVRANLILNYREELENRGDCPKNHQWCYSCKSFKKNKEYSPTSFKNHRPCRECSNKYDIERTRIFKKKAIEYLGGKCKRCNFVGHFASYDFHHLDPKTKEMNWNKMRKKSWNNLLPELNKCILLCSNCHQIIHCKVNDDGSLNNEYIPSNLKK